MSRRPSVQRRDLRRACALGGPCVQAATAAPLAVGVFGDVPAAEVARIVEQVGLDAVQLHGGSGPEAGLVREALAGWEPPLRLAGPCPVAGRSEGGSNPSQPPTGSAPEEGSLGVLIIQAVPVALARMTGALSGIWSSARVPAPTWSCSTPGTAGRFGGTGTPFPWGLARESAVGSPLLVAGGIDPDNVLAALEESSAWGVDVSSGVEVSPGVKDARLMERLFAQVAEARRAATRADGPRT